MKFEYDREADAAYIRLRDAAYVWGRDLDDSRRIDYGDDGQPIGIELLNVSLGVSVEALPQRARVERLLARHAIRIFA
jgi:uncharacterized protein YuzE